MICYGCERPGYLHCPGCNTCWPDQTCPPDCDATDAEMDAVLASALRWDEEYEDA